ncbi:MAG: carboxypeptidase-like regulatory domain-containing protein [bacterium]
MRKFTVIILSLLILTSGCTKLRRVTNVIPLGELNGKVSPAVQATVSLYKDNIKVWEENSNPATGEFNASSLTSGSYYMTISADGFEPVNQTIAVQEGEMRSVEINLTKLKLNFGEIEGQISPVVPATIILYRDNLKIWEGSADSVTGEFHIGSLISGSYDLKVLADGFVLVDKYISVQAGQVSEIKVELTQNFVPGEVIVSFKDEITKEEAQQIISSYGLNDTEWDNWVIAHFIIVKVPTDIEAKWIAEFQKSPKIKYAELNYIYSIF